MPDKQNPLQKQSTNTVQQTSSSQDIAAFVKAASETPAAGDGRLIFALDATMSRQPTWDRACQIQASMFTTAAKTKGLSVQLVYFRGFGECRASKWVSSASGLANMMTGIDCRGGQTQIGKVLSHSMKETRKNRVAALVFIGDAMEEQIDALCAKAGELGLLGVKAFMFQEGRDGMTERTFREIARLTNGAYMRLSGNSARELEELLKAVAAFASGGRPALEAQGGKGARALIEQLKR